MEISAKTTNVISAVFTGDHRQTGTTLVVNPCGGGSPHGKFKLRTTRNRLSCIICKAQLWRDREITVAEGKAADAWNNIDRLGRHRFVC